MILSQEYLVKLVGEICLADSYFPFLNFYLFIYCSNDFMRKISSASVDTIYLHKSSSYTSTKQFIRFQWLCCFFSSTLSY